jgi:hypothetical protein
MVVDDGDDFLALLVLVAGIADAIAPFLATVLVPSPCSTLVSRCFLVARCRTLAMKACQSDPVVLKNSVVSTQLHSLITINSFAS